MNHDTDDASDTHLSTVHVLQNKRSLSRVVSKDFKGYKAGKMTSSFAFAYPQIFLRLTKKMTVISVKSALNDSSTDKDTIHSSFECHMTVLINRSKAFVSQ